MKVSLKQAQKISQLLDCSLIDYRFLAKGNHNWNYLLHTDKRNLILRMENNAQFKNLKKEYTLLRKLKSGLGPKVFLFDKSHKIVPTNYLIEEYIVGKHPQKITEDFLLSMAQWFKQLHKITKHTSSEFSLDSALKPYYRNYLKYKHHIKDKRLLQQLEYTINKAKEICTKNKSIFKNRRKRVLLHNDSSRENIFYKKGLVQLIDWEFASYGFPERELVYFIDSYDLLEEQKRIFLKEYGYPTNASAQKQLQAYFIIHLCSSVGYSLWRLDLLKNTKEKKETITRLKKDLDKLTQRVNIYYETKSKKT
ncbi:aminoglycoside phosphotransferase family protein [Candidatus Woesearchaeota archaeon]|nr:aminoglycoside phosphotransferase family protein [Candidatus Woesearchaeota archaeon]